MKKSLSGKKIKNLLVMISDSEERALLQNAYPETESKRCQFIEPTNPDEYKKLRQLMKKLKKARRGPRMLRLSIVLVLVGLIVIFNLFFLDGILERRLESSLETILETDVEILGFYTRLFRGIVNFEYLSIASTTDPMIDVLRIGDMRADCRLSALLKRRLVMEEVKAGIQFNASRDRAAVYPAKREADNQKRPERSSVGFSADWMPMPEIPEATTSFAGDLRMQSEKEFAEWALVLESEGDRIEDTLARAREFLDQPLPASGEAQAWLTRIDDGGRLLSELQDLEENAQRNAEELRSTAELASQTAREAEASLETDLAALESSLEFDEDFINTWIEAAVNEFVGTWTADVYRRYTAFRSRSAGRYSGTLARKTKNSVKRMERGRIVSFPVDLPPRFSITRLELQGSGVDIRGRDVGIDHDLSQRPSILILSLRPESGIPANIDARITVDDRTGSPVFLLADFSVDGFSAETDGIGMDIAVTGNLQYQRNDGPAESEGNVMFSRWDGALVEPIQIDLENAPPLELSYKAVVLGDSAKIDVGVAESSLRTWSAVLGESLLPAGLEAAREKLETEIGEDLEVLEKLAASWRDQAVVAESLNSQLSAIEKELRDSLDRWKRTLLPDSVPVDTDALLGGLNSLF